MNRLALKILRTCGWELEFSKVFETGLVLSARLFDGRARVWVLIKVLKVGVAGKFGNPGRLDLLGGDHDPVDSPKPGVVLHVFGRVHHAA